MSRRPASTLSREADAALLETLHLRPGERALILRALRYLIKGEHDTIQSAWVESKQGARDRSGYESIKRDAQQCITAAQALMSRLQPKQQPTNEKGDPR